MIIYIANIQRRILKLILEEETDIASECVDDCFHENDMDHRNRICLENYFDRGNTSDESITEMDFERIIDLENRIGETEVDSVFETLVEKFSGINLSTLEAATKCIDLMCRSLMPR